MAVTPWLVEKSALSRLGASPEAGEWASRIECDLVLALLADRGRHRAPSIPDRLIAATAELAGLVVLHCDEDFRPHRRYHRSD